MQGKIWAIGLFSVIVLVFFVLIPTTAFAADNGGKKLIYGNDFSIDPFTAEGGWKTNSQNSFNWDQGKKALHFVMSGSTGAYAYVPVDFPLESCFIEYDVIPVRIDTDTAFRFGLGENRMDITQGPILISTFFHERARDLMGLSVITQNNNKVEVSSRIQSYGGDTVQFVENTTYHVIIAYNKPGKTVSMKVLDKETGIQVWGYYVGLGTELMNINRMLLTTVGDYSQNGGKAEGYLDNVEMYRLVSPDSELTPVETTRVPEKTLTKETATPDVPVTTRTVPTATKTPPPPTQSSAGLIPVFAGLGAVFLLAGRGLR